MSFGVIEYENGKPKCEICGKYFHRVLLHVWQKHFMTERDYKLQFGFDLGKGICSESSSQKSRDKVLENYDTCIAENFKNKSATQFKKGHSGRTKDKVSAQTRTRLKDRLKEDYMVTAMKNNGVKVGKSGLGNKTRWGGKNA